MDKRKENALMLLSKFRMKILENESFIQPFSIRKESDFYHFFADKVGKAFFVYGIHSWHDKKVHGDITNKVSPVAIVLKNNIIIIDMLFFNVWNNDEISLPPNMMLLSTYAKEINSLMQKSAFNSFYNNLPVIPLEDKNYEMKARKALLMGESFAHTPPNLFSYQDIVNSLCGFINLEKYAIENLNANKEEWIQIKAEEDKICKLILENKVAESWEKDLARALLNTDAVNVTVEFIRNGKVSSAKIAPTIILRRLTYKESFSSYDFPTNNVAKEVFTTLDVSYYTWCSNCLKCEHINKITYRKKDLYVKEN